MDENIKNTVKYEISIEINKWVNVRWGGNT